VNVSGIVIKDFFGALVANRSNEPNRIGLCVQGTFAPELDLKAVFN
jgi:hypothetical protein